MVYTCDGYLEFFSDSCRTKMAGCISIAFPIDYLTWRGRCTTWTSYPTMESRLFQYSIRIFLFDNAKFHSMGNEDHSMGNEAVRGPKYVAKSVVMGDYTIPVFAS